MASSIGGGSAFFAAGLVTTGRPSIFQFVDVSGEAAEIDAGNVRAKTSALIGGYASDPDAGTILFVFRTSASASSAEELGRITLGPVAPGGRGNKTTLVQMSATLDVPPKTRDIDVLLIGIYGSGAYLDAYFDNISLELVAIKPPAPPQTTTTPPPPTTTTPPPATTTPSPRPSPTKKPAKHALVLVCAGKTLVATLKPAKGTKVSSVWFYVNGKLKAKDRRAPFVAAIPTKGLFLPLRVAVAIQVSGKSTFLRRQHRGC